MISLSELLSIFAVPLGIYGIYKAIKAARNHRRLNEIQQITLEEEFRISLYKDTANDVLRDFGKQKLRALSGPMRDFVTYFKLVDHVEFDPISGSEEFDGKFTPHTLAELENACRLAVKILSGGKSAVDGRPLADFGAYSGAVALSTDGPDAATSASDNIASTRDALSRLGGETRAACGHGKEKAGISRAETGLICIHLSQIIQTVNQLAIPILKILVERLEASNIPLKDIAREFFGIQNALDAKEIETEPDRTVLDSKIDWHLLSKARQNDLIHAAEAARLVKAVIDISLLNEEGFLADDVRNRLEEIQMMAIDHDSLVSRIGHRI